MPSNSITLLYPRKLLYQDLLLSRYLQADLRSVNAEALGFLFSTEMVFLTSITFLSFTVDWVYYGVSSSKASLVVETSYRTLRIKTSIVQSVFVLFVRTGFIF